LRHRSGKIIAVSSEGYNTKADMTTAFDSLITSMSANNFTTRSCNK